VETASRLRSNLPETLADYPSRLLLQMLGRTAPDADRVQRDLEALLKQPGAVAATVAPTQTSPGSGPPGDDNSLDMTR
jgi:hypothetical protein